MSAARTFVYRNLHRGAWSMRLRGRVIDRRPVVALRDVRFRVGEAGRQRVLRERRKNVHAGAAGFPMDVRPFVRAVVTAYPEAEPVRVSYNPYRGATFYRCDTGEAIAGAAFVSLESDGNVYAWGIIPAGEE